MRRILPFTLALVLACGGQVGEGGSTDTSAASTEVSMEGGVASVSVDGELPDGFDLPLPSTYEVDQVVEQTGEGLEQVTVSVRFPTEEAEALSARMTEHLEAAGYEVTVVAQGMATVTGRRDGATVLLQVFATEGEPESSAVYTIRTPSG